MELLKKFLIEELKITDDKIYKKFLLYNDFLLEWNKKINLISRKSISTEDQILNSIFFLTKYSFDTVNSVVDIGTGGGFPGIPLKILFPEKKIILVDSIRKKINVLNDIIEKLNLENIKVVCGRAEEISKKDEFKNKSDIVISKAVSTLEKLYEWGKEFLDSQGKILSIKGGDVSSELNSLGKKKNVKVINYDFDPSYKIEDKTLVVIHQLLH